MCVITVCEQARPNAEQIGNMFLSNDDGAGIAWREKGRVLWRKGLDLAQITSMIAEAPMPFVAHFRTASVGDPIPDLTHPFPISKRSTNDLSGETDGDVLFHNGTWNGWRVVGLEATFRAHLQLPLGKWSDSRMMAILAAHFGLGFLDLLDEKVVAFGPKETEIFGFPKGWSWKYGFWSSNLHWDWERRSLPAAYQRDGKSTGTRTSSDSGGPGSAVVSASADSQRRFKKHDELCWCDDCRALKDPYFKKGQPNQAGGPDGDANPFRRVEIAAGVVGFGSGEPRGSEPTASEEGEVGEGGFLPENPRRQGGKVPALTAAELAQLDRLVKEGIEQVKWVRAIQQRDTEKAKSQSISITRYEGGKPVETHNLSEAEAWELMGESVQEGMPSSMPSSAGVGGVNPMPWKEGPAMRSIEAADSTAPVSLTHQDDQERERRAHQAKMGITHFGNI